MKTTLISISIILLAVASCTTPEAESTELSQKDKDEILETFMATKDAWNNGDLIEFMKGYRNSDEIVFCGSSGPIYGYDATLEIYQNGYPDLDTMGKLDFEVLKLYKIDTNTAIMIGKFYLTRVIGDAMGYYTLIWQKADEKWLIISDHSSGQDIE